MNEQATRMTQLGRSKNMTRVALLLAHTVLRWGCCGVRSNYQEKLCCTTVSDSVKSSKWLRILAASQFGVTPVF